MLAVTALAGCNRAPKPPLVFGASAWPGYESIYLARSQGYLPKEGIRLEEYVSASEVAKAFRAHKVHLAAVTLSEALLLHHDVPDLKIVLVLDSSNGADALLAQPGIDTLAQLQGKRIVAENAVHGAYFMSLAAKEVGLSAQQFDVSPLPVNEQEAAFRSHKVDAVVAAEPLRSRLLADGARQLFDSSRIPGKMLDVLVTRDDDIGDYNHEMLQLLQGWHRALDYIRYHPVKAAQAMAKDQQADPAQFERALQGVELFGLQRNREMLLDDPPGIGPAIDGLQRFMLDSGLLRMGADASTLIDTALVANIGR
jgi:NitT/TauT family transport system substrate-binding protein